LDGTDWPSYRLYRWRYIVHRHSEVVAADADIIVSDAEFKGVDAIIGVSVAQGESPIRRQRKCFYRRVVSVFLNLLGLVSFAETGAYVIWGTLSRYGDPDSLIALGAVPASLIRGLTAPLLLLAPRCRPPRVCGRRLDLDLGYLSCPLVSLGRPFESF